jgi:hypothetical protein
MPFATGTKQHDCFHVIEFLLAQFAEQAGRDGIIVEGTIFAQGEAITKRGFHDGFLRFVQFENEPLRQGGVKDGTCQNPAGNIILKIVFEPRGRARDVGNK